jgi:hypothetical protein
MMRLSCRKFRPNEVRLWLTITAYKLGNLWRRLVLPQAIGNWSLTTVDTSETSPFLESLDRIPDSQILGYTAGSQRGANSGSGGFICQSVDIDTDTTLRECYKRAGSQKMKSL